MPVFHLNVDVYEMGPEVEKELSKIGKITGKIEPIKTYFLQVEIKGNTPREIAKSYRNLLLDLVKRSYVSSVERSVELEKLNA